MKRVKTIVFLFLLGARAGSVFSLENPAARLLAPRSELSRSRDRNASLPLLSEIPPNDSEILFGDLSYGGFRDMLSFFAAYPGKIPLMGTLETGPVMELVSLRDRLYREIQKGSLRSNLERLGAEAARFRENLVTDIKGRLSLEYELSLLGISPAGEVAAVPRYLRNGEVGLRETVPVEVENYPFADDWTALPGFEEEMARCRVMRVHFQITIGNVFDVRFQPRTFEDNLASLGLHADDFSGKDILEIGVNEGQLGRYLAKHAAIKNYTGIDWDLDALSQGHPPPSGMRLYAMNNKSLAFPDDSFDWICLNNFIGPCYYREMRRVLRAGGAVLVTGVSNKEGALPNGLYRFSADGQRLFMVKSMPAENVIAAFERWREGLPSRSPPDAAEALRKLIYLMLNARNAGLRGSRQEIEAMLDETIFRRVSYDPLLYDAVESIFKAFEQSGIEGVRRAANNPQWNANTRKMLEGLPESLSAFLADPENTVFDTAVFVDLETFERLESRMLDPVSSREMLQAA
jgi:SAM-dependent methyltransferase